jgi:hypothetical protein
VKTGETPRDGATTEDAMQCSAATRWAIYKSKSSTRSVPRRFAGLSVVVICFSLWSLRRHPIARWRGVRVGVVLRAGRRRRGVERRGTGGGGRMREGQRWQRDVRCSLRRMHRIALLWRRR